MDVIEAAGDAVNVVVFTNEGKFWSNGADLMYMSKTDGDGIKAHGVQLDNLLCRVLIVLHLSSHQGSLLASAPRPS